MKLQKIPINQVEEVDLDEMVMCRLLGGAGCCQCGCHYPAISSTEANSGANNALGGYTSDPGPQTTNCCTCTTTPPPPPNQTDSILCGDITLPTLSVSPACNGPYHPADGTIVVLGLCSLC